MQIDTAKLRASTKGWMGMVIAAGSLFQIPQVHDFLILQAHDHPHLTGLIGTITGIAGLLHIPQVQDALGIKRTVEIKTEEVLIAPGEKQ
jgi:hypothetical protein